MAAPAFGTIILVPFPFTDQSAAKQRPAVVVSSSAYHRARLLRPSAIKPVLATLEQSLVIKPLGTLTPRDQAALKALIPQLPG